MATNVLELEEFDPSSVNINGLYVVSKHIDSDSNQQVPTPVGTKILPAGVTLSFMGGMLSGTTLTGGRTKIIAPVTQIFDANLNVTGTWDIPQAFPQWFGAVASTSVTSDTADSAGAINKAIAMKQNSEV